MSFKNKIAEWAARTAVRFPRAFWAVFRAREWTRQKWQEATPGDRAWRGAALGLLVATIIVVADAFLHRAMLPHPTFDRVRGALGTVGEAALLGVGLIVLASVVGRMPWRYKLALGACGGILASSFPFSMDERGLIWALLAFSAAGAGLAAISREDRSVLTPLQRRIAVAGIVAGVGTVAYLLYWVGNPGFEPLEYRNAATESAVDGEAVVEVLALPDPSVPGEYPVLYLTYGSGDDIRRAEFGRDADLVTGTVDGRPFLASWSGGSGEERKNFWGFDRDELPLQGRVWYPDGDGPFPLVLIVHGNHSMYEYSDPGYQYLGELLASRGFILVSVDENFINGSIRTENDARGWLLLEHLAQWERWNAGDAGDESDSGGLHEQAGQGEEDEETTDGRSGAMPNPFEGKVDMGRIGLIGHSRGGEAVAVAAAFNTLPYYPDDATVPFEYGFDIGAVIAIAPVMGQYQPGGRYTDMHDVNYFVIHGANDGDVSSFNGAGQYEHVWFSGDPYRFKSSLYVMGANHGQFNQVWGSWDSGAPFGRSLSTRSLIPEPDQRKVAEVYLSAFLEAALRGEHGYLPLFADARVGREWLPETAYLVEFDDSRSIRVATFDEDVDVTTATVAGGRTWAENLNVWREQRVSMKSRTKETAGVYLGWEIEEVDEGEDAESEDEREHAAVAAEGEGSEVEPVAATAGTEAVEGGAGSGELGAGEETAEGEGDADSLVPRYIIELPAGFTVDPSGFLFFSLADANESSSMPDHLKENEEEQGQQNEAQQAELHADEQQPGEQQAQHDKQPQQPAEQQQEADQGPQNDADADDAEEEDEPREPIDFTVRFVDADGAVAELPLSRFSMVQPQLEVQLRKAFLDEPRTESEAVFQSFLFPLEWFREANPRIDPSRPGRLELVFDRSTEGVVILDTVGFRSSFEL